MRWLLRADSNATTLTRSSASGSPSEHSCCNLHRGRILLRTGKNRTLPTPVPISTQACNTNLKNVHREPLWFLWGVVYQALNLLVLKSDSAAGWLIPLPGWEQTEATSLLQTFLSSSLGSSQGDDSQMTVSVSLVCSYTHILKQMFSFLHWEVTSYLPSVLTYMLIIKIK